MKLQRTTVFLIILTLGLGSFIYFTEIRGKQGQETLANKEEEKAKKPLFNFSKDEIKFLTIETQDQILKFEQTEDKTQPWKMIQPDQVTASEASLSFLLNLFIEVKNRQVFNTNKEELKEYGLAQPQTKILIELKDQQQYEISLGKSNFDDTLIYAQVDPNEEQSENIEVILVSKSFQYAVERDLNDWKQIEENQEKSLEQP